MGEKDQRGEHDELRRVMESEQRRGRRPIDFEERDRQQTRKAEMVRAIRERRWEDVKAALLVLYDKDSDEYKKAIEKIKAFDPSARI
ncbi:MAG: hypothetical protein WBM04_01545 [Candidatus Korobacteraceae bacterium]